MLAVPASVLIGFAAAGLGTAGHHVRAQAGRTSTWCSSSRCRCSCSAPRSSPSRPTREPLRTFVEITPLYRGVHLLRGLTTGTLDPTIAVRRRSTSCVLGLIGMTITVAPPGQAAAQVVAPGSAGPTQQASLAAPRSGAHSTGWRRRSGGTRPAPRASRPRSRPPSRVEALLPPQRPGCARCPARPVDARLDAADEPVAEQDAAARSSPSGAWAPGRRPPRRSRSRRAAAAGRGPRRTGRAAPGTSRRRPQAAGASPAGHRRVEDGPAPRPST